MINNKKIQNFGEMCWTTRTEIAVQNLTEYFLYNNIANLPKIEL